MIGMIHGQKSEFTFNNGKNGFRDGTTKFMKGICQVSKVDYQGKKLVGLMVSGPREGMRTQAFLTPDEVETLGEHLIRVAKDLKAGPPKEEEPCSPA